MTTRTFVRPEHDDQRVNQFVDERPLCARSGQSGTTLGEITAYFVLGSGARDRARRGGGMAEGRVMLTLVRRRTETDARSRRS